MRGEWHRLREGKLLMKSAERGRDRWHFDVCVRGGNKGQKRRLMKEETLRQNENLSCDKTEIKVDEPLQVQLFNLAEK